MGAENIQYARQLEEACGKIAFAWRGGRAAEGACLENMFGSHQRGFESHPLRQADLIP